MRAKRSKKYRKTMAAYQLHFSFRQPYQVLCDSSFLRQCHAFAMPVQKFLSNTLHGEARPFLTRCSLRAAEAAHRAKSERESKTHDSNNRKKTENGGGGGRGRGDGRPEWLPLPTEVPLRYCKHRDAEGKEVEALGEGECLVDLVGGQAKGNETKKNKNHYVLATAESEEELAAQQQRNQSQNQNLRKRKRGEVDVREAARQIPGVPIVYVKRSVMILEEMSGASERLIRGLERDKFREGLVGAARGTKRKREEGDESDSENDEEIQQEQGGKKSGGYKKAKGPNPLSMRKKKVRPEAEFGSGHGQNGTVSGEGGDGEQNKSSGRKRKRGKKKTVAQQDTKTEGTIGVVEVEGEA